MAKRKPAKQQAVNSGTGGIVSMSMPTLAPPTPEELAAEEEQVDVAIADVLPASEEPEPPTITVAVEVPLRGEYNIGPAHVDAQLNRNQATTMRRLQDALDHEHKRLRNGRPVFTRADVVRWLLESIRDKSEEV